MKNLKLVMLLSLILISTIIFSGCQNVSTNKTQKADKQLEKIKYEDARLATLSLVQAYKIKKNINKDNLKYEIDAGVKLVDVFKNQKQSGYLNSDGRWIVVKDNERFVVIYRSSTFNGYLNNPQWSVKGNDIKALNGTAIKYTPELGYQNPTLDVNNLTKTRKVYLRWMEIVNNTKYDKIFNGNDDDLITKTENKIAKKVADEFNISAKDAKDMFFTGMHEENDAIEKENNKRGAILSDEILTKLLKDQGDLYIPEN